MNERTHQDNLGIIGSNWTTAAGRHDIQWNRYYYKTNAAVVSRMLYGVKRGSILDVGTSNGSGLTIFKSKGSKEFSVLNWIRGVLNRLRSTAM